MYAETPKFKTRSSQHQRKFVQLYVQYGKDLVRAFVESRRYPPVGTLPELRKQAKVVLKNVAVQRLLKEVDANALAAIEIKNHAGMENVMVEYGISKERVMAELAKIAFASPGDVMKWGPDGVEVKKSDELTPEQMAAIGEVYDAGGGEKGSNVRIKLLDKQQALLNLGRELGMFSQKVDVKGQVAVAARFIVEK